MAQRLSFDERARVEAMSAAGVSVAAAARCLGRHRSTVYRELRRGRRGGAYDAEAAQAAAAVGAARPKTPVLAADPELAASVRELLKEGWSPHAICAGLRAEGRTVSAETIYRWSSPTYMPEQPIWLLKHVSPNYCVRPCHSSAARFSQTFNQNGAGGPCPYKAGRSCTKASRPYLKLSYAQRSCPASSASRPPRCFL